MKLVQWVWLCMTSFFLISYQSIRFKFFLFTTLKEEEGKPKWENQLRFQWIFTDFRPVISLIATTITAWNFWVGWITNTPKILWRLCATHMAATEILFDKSHKDVNGLDNWIVALLSPYFLQFVLTTLFFLAVVFQRNNNCWFFLVSNKLSSIAINFIDKNHCIIKMWVCCIFPLVVRRCLWPSKQDDFLILVLIFSREKRRQGLDGHRFRLVMRRKRERGDQFVLMAGIVIAADGQATPNPPCRPPTVQSWLQGKTGQSTIGTTLSWRQ